MLSARNLYYQSFREWLVRLAISEPYDALLGITQEVHQKCMQPVNLCVSHHNVPLKRWLAIVQASHQFCASVSIV